MGGFGGSMKNIAIGCVSGQVGKRQVHGVAGEPPTAEPTIPDIGILASTDIRNGYERVVSKEMALLAFLGKIWRLQYHCKNAFIVFLKQ